MFQFIKKKIILEMFRKFSQSIFLCLVLCMIANQASAGNCSDGSLTTACNCSVQTGSLGTCGCSNANLIRQDWVCSVNGGEDSVKAKF